MPPRHETLAVAETLLTEGGPAAVSARRVAERLGVSRQLIYTQFGDKSGLLRALHDEGFRRLDDRIGAVASRPRSDRDMLALVSAYREAALAAPEIYALMFDRPPPDFRKDSAAVRVGRASFAHIIAASRSWLDAQTIDTVGKDVALALALWSTAHGHVALERAGHIPADSGQILEESVRLLLAGARAG